MDTGRESITVEDLTAFQRDCLNVIAGRGVPKGTAILDALDEYYENDIHHGRLYPSLDDLVDEGFIAKGKKDDRTNEYQLADDAVQILEE